MALPSFLKPHYVALEDVESPQDMKLEMERQPLHLSVKRAGLGWITSIMLLAGVCGLSLYTFLTPRNKAACSTPAPSSSVCMLPSIRREWRTLDSVDKNRYIAAVQCLGTKPSIVQENGTRYDDFPWIHKATASQAHKSAPFLPWHRYFIHAYERALKDECGFSGVLPYWDWSQDYRDFTASPVWDSITGFGGDGNTTSDAAETGEGHCVTDGPFANLAALYYNDEYQPHCLSRGFASGAPKAELGELVNPISLYQLGLETNFEDFAPELERRAHTFVRDSIRGDFSKYTGPYDPIFFLHHANLDRLWDKWQHADAASRIGAYAGPANSLTDTPASLNDVLDVGGLLPAVSVHEVMQTTGGMFCYTY